jgi:hypothetical protein
MEFVEFPKMARLSREIFITEKIDGTNASITITEDGQLLMGSRTRWITVSDDNHGFARWATENREELMKLGPGSHFGEWWGKGIQRNYSLTEKRFSLFNVSRWLDDATRPACCHVVPVLFQGAMEEYGVLKGVKAALGDLTANGSKAAPGFMKPEGIVIYHTAANLYFKKTLEKDEMSKGEAERRAKEVV